MDSGYFFTASIQPNKQTDTKPSEVFYYDYNIFNSINLNLKLLLKRLNFFLMFQIQLNKKSHSTHNIVPLVTTVFIGFVLLFIFISYNYSIYLNQLDTVISKGSLESQKMRLSSELMELARSRTRLTSQIIDTEDPFEQDEINMQLDIYASRFSVRRKQLAQLELTPEEQAILKQQAAIVPTILPAQRRAVELAMTNSLSDEKEAEQLLYKTVLPGQGEMVDLFSQLIVIEQDRINELSLTSRASIEATKQRSYLLIGIALGILIMLSSMVIIRIRKIQNALIDSHKNLEITVQHRTVELHSAQAMLQTVLNTIPVRVYWKDLDGIYLGANSLFAQDAGYDSPEQVIGKTDSDMPWANQTDKNKADDLSLIESGKPRINYNEFQQDSNGNTIWFESSKVPLLDNKNLCIGLLGTYHDITARKVAEDQLKDAIKAAEAANVQKNQFLATMSHEIRTPMNGVLGMAQLLSAMQLNKKQQEYVQAILNSGELLLTIINDILDYSKLGAEKVNLENISFNLELLSHDVLQLLLPTGKKKNIELIFDYPLDLPRFFNGDPARLRQILFNLIGNAIKFTEKGYVRLFVRCKQLNQKQANISINIEDTGIGITTEQKNKLFNSFTQADSSTTRKYGGTGLGLAICKQLVSLMQGNISITSEQGKGSIFTIELCLSLSPSPTESAKKDLSGVRILLLEENPVNRTLFSNMLHHLGAILKIISEPEGVLPELQKAMTQEKPYQMVLLDNDTSKESCINLAQSIQSDANLNNPHLIALSSLSQHGDARVFEQAGFTGYLSKPIRGDILQAVLERVMGVSNKDSGIITRHQVIEEEYSQENIERFNNPILLVEDTLVNQQVANAMLTKLGFTVDLAENGAQALKLWRHNKYDLIFMDCRMPVMDGYEATKIIRSEEQNNTHIPIIALTANATKQDQHECYSTGMDEVVIKPFKPDDIIKAVLKWLDPIKEQNFVESEQLSDAEEANTTYNSTGCIDNKIFKQVEQLLGDNFDELISGFYKNVDDIISRIESWKTGDDLNELIRLPHSLKSITANVGAMNLSHLAEQFEHFVSNNQIEQAMADLNTLKLEFETVKETLGNLGYEYKK